MKFNDIHSNSDGLPEEIDITTQDDTSDEIVLIEGSGAHIDTIHDTEKGPIERTGIKDPQVTHSPTKNFDSIHSAKKLFSSLDASGKPSWHTRLFGSKYLNDHHHVYGRYMGIIQLAAVLFFLACFLWLSKLFVISYVESGYQRLLKLRDDAGNITRMQEHLNDARFDFILADILYFPFQIIPQKDIQNGYHIIKAGKYLTELGDRSFYLYSGISEQIQSRGIEHISYVQLLRNLKTEFEQTQYQLGQAISHYDSIEDLSDGYIAYKIDQANQILKKAYSFNRLLNLNYDAFLDIIGASGPRKYLIVFQNADEIRPTGGFMGSMGIVTIQNGQLIDFDKRDVYNYEWNLKTADYQRIPAPEGINRLTEYLGLRDANYRINLESSSNNIRFFINEAGFEIDGVIYLNQNLIIDALKATGPVQLSYLDRPISSENFSAFISTIVEAKLTKIGTLGTPKQVLFDFIDQYIQDINEKGLYPELASVLADHILRKQIGVYSFRKDENTILKQLGFNLDRDYDSTLDFNYPVYTSVGGNKSDRYIKREYAKTVEIGESCEIQTNFEITLKHLMTKNKQDEIRDIISSYDIPESGKILQIQGLSPNKSFIRVLLPKNARVNENGLFSVVEHAHVKEVNFFMTTQVLETRKFNIFYSLPNPNCEHYDFQLYNQPGIAEYTIQVTDGINTAQKSGVTGDFYYSSEQ